MIHEGVAQLLGSAVEGLAYSESTAEGNVFIDHLPETPDRAVGVYTVPGGEPDAKLPYTPVAFQVIVRCEAGSDWALRRAEAIFAALHAYRYQTLPDGTAVVFILGIQGSPFRLGPDENGRENYSMSFRAEVRRGEEQA